LETNLDVTVGLLPQAGGGNQLRTWFRRRTLGNHSAMTETIPALPPLESEHSPQQERPLRSYGALMVTFTALAAGFGVWYLRSGRELPESIGARDFALLTVASHKISRMVAKDRVTSPVRAPFTRFEDDAGPGEVDESARGRGLRRAIGELLLCPHCLGLWASSGLTALLLVFPRFTRWFAATLSTYFGSELLQIGYKKTQELLGD
jgi:hypothetical protein